MKSTHFVALGTIGMALLLAGCRVNVITQVESSGAGMLTTEIGMTPEEVEELRSMDSDPAASACETLSLKQEGAGAATAFAEELRSEDTWCVSTQAFDDLESLGGLYRDFETVTIRELVLREGLVVYDIEVDAAAGEGSLMPVEVTWTLGLPGKLGSHNADAVDGSQLVWHLNQGETTRLQASSDLFALDLPFDWDGIGTRFPAWIIGAVLCFCCGGVLVLLAIVLVLLLRQRH